MRNRIVAGFLGVAGLVLLGMQPAQAQVNVLANPGFESGALGPWFVDRDFGGTLWSVTNVNPDSGTFHARANGNNEIRQNFSPVATSLIVEASFRLAQPPGENVNFVTFFYSDNTETGFLLTTGANYSTFDVTANLTPGKFLTGFSLFGNSGAGPTDLDNARIMANLGGGGSAPEPSSLLLCGLLPGAFFLARRRSR